MSNYYYFRKKPRVRLIHLIVSFLIIVNLRILDFGDWQEIYRIITAVFALLLCIYCLLNKKIQHRISPYCKKYNIWMISVIGLILAETINGWLNGSYHLVTYIGYDYIYLWLLLFYPIIYIGVADGGYEKLIKYICFATLFALLLKTYVWWQYNYYERDVMHYLLYEFTEEWIRRGHQRIPSTCFSGILFAIALQTIFNSKRMRDKVPAIIILIFSFWYAWEVFASRAQIIAFLIAACIALVFGERNLFRRVLLYVGITVVAIALLNTVFAQDFISGLSVQTYSIGIRVKAIEYYINLLKTRPLLGGLYVYDTYTMRGTTGNYYISDMGYIGTLFEFGWTGFFIFLWPLCYMIKIAFYNKRRTMFLISVVLYTVVFSILSNNIYNFRYIFALPFILAYCTYEEVSGKNNRVVLNQELWDRSNKQ